MSLGSILVVDDEVKQLEILRKILLHEGYEVETAASATRALEQLRVFRPQVVLTDLMMPGMDGIELLEQIRRESPGCAVLLMTAHESVATAVDAMKKGAYDYLTKPLERDDLVPRIARAFELVLLRNENRNLRAQLRSSFSFDEIVGSGTAMESVLRLVRKVAPSNATILIVGESGTGKELVARALHYGSPRAERPFLAVNCSAIPETLLESELFGHEKGSFTGAIGRKLGLFEQAQGGTLFLDEVGDLPLSMQAKLLRALQEREIRRVGGSASIPLDIRIVAATNRDLTKLMKDERFREDLYYRLNVVTLLLPPLRERPDDIPRLVEAFLERFSREAGRTPPRFSRKATAELACYGWPGNVRQLESVVERAVLLSEGDEIGPELLPPEVREGAARGESASSSGLSLDIPDAGINLEEVERELLEKAVRKAGGTLSRAAKLLGISYRTLQYRLDKFGIGRGEGPAVPDGAPSARNGVPEAEG
jgi:DNA-binding NtrC family response regulator